MGKARKQLEKQLRKKSHVARRKKRAAPHVTTLPLKLSILLRLVCASDDDFSAACDVLSHQSPISIRGIRTCLEFAFDEYGYQLALAPQSSKDDILRQLREPQQQLQQARERAAASRLQQQIRQSQNFFANSSLALCPSCNTKSVRTMHGHAARSNGGKALIQRRVCLQGCTPSH
jgi:hypothetical protein